MCEAVIWNQHSYNWSAKVSFLGPEPELLSNLSIVLLMWASLPSWKEWYETKLPNCVVIASLLSCYLFSLCSTSRVKYYLGERWRSKQSQAHIISNKLHARAVVTLNTIRSVFFSSSCCDHLPPCVFILYSQQMGGKHEQCAAMKCVKFWMPFKEELQATVLGGGLADIDCFCAIIVQLRITSVNLSLCWVITPLALFWETWCNCRRTSLCINYKIIRTHFECTLCRLLVCRKGQNGLSRGAEKNLKEIECNVFIHKLSVRR